MEWIALAIAAVAVLEGLILVRVKRVAERVEELAARVADPATREAVDRIPDRIVRPVADTVARAAADALDDLSTRLETLRQEVRDLVRREPEAAPAPRVADEVGPLLEEAVDSLEARIRELVASLESRRDEGISETLTRGLAERGFVDVRIVGDPAFEGERTRVVVSARREGMPFKGAVLLAGRRIVEDRLAPAYPMFP